MSENTDNNTTNTDNLVIKLLALSVSCSRQAGAVVRQVRRSGKLGVRQKTGPKDLQTEADRRSQQLIVRSIKGQFPSVRVIGEEDDDADDGPLDQPIVTVGDDQVLQCDCPDEWRMVRPEDITVWVDPLDGTAEFTEGLLTHVTVLIGLSVRGRAVAGVIHQPFYGLNNDTDSDQTVDDQRLGRSIWGLIGLPPDSVVGVEHWSPPDGGLLILTTTRSHSNQSITDTLQALGADQVLRVGGSGHKVIQVLEGVAHAYVFPSRGTKKWDTCAAEAVLECFGGRLTDVFGQRLAYEPLSGQYMNETGVLATGRATAWAGLHERIVRQIPVNVKQILLANKK